MTASRRRVGRLEGQRLAEHEAPGKVHNVPAHHVQDHASALDASLGPDFAPSSLSRLAAGGGSVREVMALQRLAGNRAVSRMLAGPAGKAVSESAGRGSSNDWLGAPSLRDADAGGSATILQFTQSAARVSRRSDQLTAAADVTTADAHEDAHPHAIQRHSSWEHKLLGDADPKKLSEIGTWQNLIDQTALKGRLGSRTREKESAQETIKLTTPNGEVDHVVNKGTVMHTLAQEMQRVKAWQDAPPAGTGTGDPFKAVGNDPTYDVLLVKLPAADPAKSLVITYGEMNTLADFYGDLETMKTANPKQREQIVQSVRKETFLRLQEIYTKLKKSLTSTEKQNADVIGAEALYKTGKLGSAKFAGAAAPDFISGVKGQADLLAGDKPLIGQGTGAAGATNKYGVTLARNACHFVPESWHAWALYHDAALTAAHEAFTLRQDAKQLSVMGDSKSAADKKAAEASEKANEAILNNGFGDHYLQDSYAAGHMINKTQIMQWYVEFIDKSAEWDYFKDKNWRKVQQMAYRQPGLADAMQYDKAKVQGATGVGVTAATPRNPQSVENMDGTWEQRFDALGLQVPASLSTPGSPERKLVEWWQLLAGAGGERERNGSQLTATGPLSKGGLQAALKNLILDGVVRTDESVETRGSYMASGAAMANARFTRFDESTFILRDDYVPEKKKLAAFKAALAKSKGSAASPGKAAVAGDDSDYQKMAKSVSYGDYFEFMNSGFIQKATNALHDTYCQGGLDVLSGDGAQVFKLYGDDAMFSSASAKGVEHSAMTANMSRDSITSVINTGAEGAKTTSAIVGRLPARVQYKVSSDDGEVITTVTQDIAAWHNSTERGALKDTCMTDVFPKMSGKFMQKFVPGAFGSELGKVFSKDQAVHGADAF